MATLIDIISRIRPGQGFICVGDNYDSIYSPAGDPVPPLSEIEAARATVEAAMAAERQAEIARPAARAAMRAQWDALPAWIRGPYRLLFDAANALLDAGDDEAASAMVAFAAPMPGYSDAQAATFEAVQAQFAQAIAAL